jgi:hypothetical protein
MTKHQLTYCLGDSQRATGNNNKAMKVIIGQTEEIQKNLTNQDRKEQRHQKQHKIVRGKRKKQTKI